MNYRVVTDSSSNLLSLPDVPFAVVPLHILVGEQTFVDDAHLDLAGMQRALTAYQGKTSTSCPSPENWIEAFGDAEVVFCVTITSGLSGTCGCAMTAREIVLEEHPDRTVYVIDTLSTGPEMALIVEKLRELILSGMHHEAIYREIQAYRRHTHLLFSLASLDNLARNGRVSPLIAKGVGLLGIRVIGNASDTGMLEPMSKRRGDRKAIACLVTHMRELGYRGGKVIISHTDNPSAAQELWDAIAAEFGSFNGYIHENRGLCSYYAEPQNLLVGFEG